MDGQEASEALRQIVRNDKKRTVRVNEGGLVTKYMDESEYTKQVENYYKDYRNNLHRSLEEDPELEKLRGKYGTTVYGDRFQSAELDLAESFEQIYWRHYSEGVNGEPYPSKLGTNVICQMCHLRFMMSGKLTPLKCPRCGYITPLGRLVQDGFYKR